MKRFKFSIPAIAALLLVQGACTTVPEPADQPAPECFLWEARSDTATVYLLGSVHLANDSIYPLHPTIMAAFESADTLVVEFNINKDPLATQLKMIQRAMYRDGTTLKDHVSPETWQRLIPVMERFGILGQGLKAFKPWYAAMFITAMELDRKGFSPEDGIDGYFLDLADENEKAVLELESLEAQLDVFDKSLAGNQEEFLLYTLEELERVGEVVEAMLAAWKKGDTVSLRRIMMQNLEERDDFDEVYKVLFTDRNRNMARKIKEYLAGDGTYFVVVGAGHLVGKDSIISALEKSNKYVIEQR